MTRAVYAPASMRHLPIVVAVAVLLASESIEGGAFAQTAQTAPVARSVETISVPPIQGTVSDVEGARLTGLVRSQVESAGFTALAARGPDLTGDAVLETVVVADPQGCDVQTTLRTAFGTPLRGHSTCDASSGQPAAAAQVSAAVTQAVATVLSGLPNAKNITPVVPVPVPPVPPSDPIAQPPPSSPPLPPPPPPPPTNGYAFETGINVHTATFSGLGHLVANEDDTARFNGVFMITAVKNDTGRFNGVVQLALGKNAAKEFRGGFAVGLLTNHIKDRFVGIAQMGIRLSETHKFTGVAQLTVGMNEANEFAGVTQVGAFNLARKFTGVAQIGGVNATKDKFAGVGQIGLGNYTRHDFAGLTQLGLVNAGDNTRVHVFVQAGAANLIDMETQAALQIGVANGAGAFRGGFQIGAVNINGRQNVDRLLDRKVETHNADFEGGLQLGVFNATFAKFEGGAQIGAVNAVKSGFEGGLEIAALANVDEASFSGAFQIAPVNIVYDDFAGAAQIGGANFAENVQGAQVGLSNIAGEVHGAQIGVFNRTRVLEGIQLGLLNWVADRDTLPILPVMNLGW